jgi:hypothetical protein
MAKKAAKPTNAKSTKAAGKSGGKSGGKSEGGVDVGSVLGNMEAAWSESREIEPQTRDYGPADIPDGPYIARLVGARVGVTSKGKNEGKPYLSLSFVIAYGDHEGTRLSSMDTLDNSPVGDTGRTRLDFVSEKLQKLGVETKKMPLSKLPAICAALVDPKVGGDNAKPFVRVTVKTKAATTEGGKPFQSVYVDDLVGEDELDELGIERD